MTTILFPSAVTVLVLDPAERAIFAGTSSSLIHEFNLVQSIGGKYVSVGGNPSHPLQAGNALQFDFRGHFADITAIALSFDGTLLVSGDKSGEIFVWDVPSRQVLRKIKGQNGNAALRNAAYNSSGDECGDISETRQSLSID
jgi:pre-rRNA-processing protein IPI3